MPFVFVAKLADGGTEKVTMQNEEGEKFIQDLKELGAEEKKVYRCTPDPNGEFTVNGKNATHFFFIEENELEEIIKK